MYDVCECQTNLKDCMCDSFAAYADECAKFGVPINWRKQIPMCGKYCVETVNNSLCVLGK